VPVPIAILAALVFGMFLGSINGILIVNLKVLPIVVTMGTWMAYKGLGLIMIGNRSLSNMPAAFKAIAQRWQVLGIPFNIVVMLIIMAIGMVLLKYVPFFHEAYYIGGNIESARLAGINVNRFVIIMYMLNGMMCAISGLLMLSRLGSAPSTMGQGNEFRIVTGLLIGGVSFAGGEGSILGTFLGVLLMGIISNALAILRINGNMQLVIIGFILVFAVSMDESNRRRKLKK
jgi:ribose transport system permease protein